jgi:hypothetical protein
MAIVGEECGLFPALKDWVQSNKPVRSDASYIYLIVDIDQYWFYPSTTGF